jgi:hypothetical protein
MYWYNLRYNEYVMKCCHVLYVFHRGSDDIGPLHRGFLPDFTEAAAFFGAAFGALFGAAAFLGATGFFCAVCLTALFFLG